MKLFKYGLPFAALALLASCSNDKLDGPNVDNQGNAQETYATLSISMPGLNSSRAVSQVEDHDGVEEEYRVYKGTVYVFDGSGKDNEDEYVYETSGNLDVTAWIKDGNNQVTTSSKTAVAKFEGLSLDGIAQKDYYVLVVLNPNDLAGPATPKSTTFGEWRKKPQEDTKVNTGEDAQTNPKLNVNLYGDATNGFTMTNAPKLYDANDASKTARIKTLVKIDATKIGTSPTNLSPAATVYVQRVASKVDIAAYGSKDLKAFKVELPAGITGETQDVVAFKKWGLNYTNKKTFPVQVAEGYVGSKTDWVKWFDNGFTIPSQNYFISVNTLMDGANYANEPNTPFNRVWWAEDPNYKTSYTPNADADKSPVPNADEFNIESTVSQDLDKAEYCLENTMNYNQMFKNQTTQFVITGTYWVGGLPTSGYNYETSVAPSFFAHENWRQKVTDEKFLKGNKINRTGEGSVTQYDEAVIEIAKKTDTPTEELYKTGQKGINLSNLFDITEYGKGIYVQYLKDQVPEGDDRATEQAKITWNKQTMQSAAFLYLTQLVEDYVVDYYYQGQVYYAMPIRHFDDIEMGDENIPNGTGISKYEGKHLGRYGLLRNNWYQVQINTVTGLGDPIVPQPGDTDPDDPDDKQFMDISIKILAWAKRAFQYDL
ncbi:MAG: Mfa1 fimbrilin C-terminal domain-containing protein [Muribaculaceae bacterium]|nr:Mfa1 fimbrilin C-terminal domain-containing protein [Muribaculaceae bacterium]